MNEPSTSPALRRFLAPALLFLAYALLVTANNHYATFMPKARLAEVLVFVAMAAAAAALAFAGFRAPKEAAAPPRVDWPLLAILLAFYASIVMPVVFGVDIGNRSPMLRRIAAIGFVTAGVCVLPYFLHLFSGGAARQTRRELWTSGSIAAFLVGVACAVKIAGILGEPRPYIDIWDQVQGATGMLQDGLNPYTTPNAAAIATGREHGYPTVTFPYPPTILLLTTAANRWLGDVRYLFVLSDLLSAILLLRIAAAPELSERTKRYARIGALLIVFHPNSFAKMWNDLLIIPLLFAMTLLVMRASRKGAASPYGAAAIAGLALSTKQYLVTLVPLFVLWLRKPKALGIATVAGLLPALPFLIWDAAALWQSTFAFHLKTPFRHDSMSLASFTHHVFGELPPRWLGYAALAVFLAGGVWAVKKRGFVALCAWSAVALLWLFGLGQHTFHNYYHGVCGFLLWGGLALAIESDAPGLVRVPAEERALGSLRPAGSL